MKRFKFMLSVAAIVLSLPGFAQAVIVNTYDWTSGATAPLVQVTEMFFTDSEITGSMLDETPLIHDNLFLYSVQNLSTNNGIKIFSVPNPDNVSAVMFAAAHPTDPGHTPIPWLMSNTGGRFIWEAPSAFDYINPGETLSGFELFTESGVADRGVITSPPYPVTSIGWAQFLPDVNVYGPVSGPVTDNASVPEPMTMLILGSGLVGIALMRRKLS